MPVQFFKFLFFFNLTFHLITNFELRRPHACYNFTLEKCMYKCIYVHIYEFRKLIHAKHPIDDLFVCPNSVVLLHYCRLSAVLYSEVPSALWQKCIFMQKKTNYDISAYLL